MNQVVVKSRNAGRVSVNSLDHSRGKISVRSSESLFNAAGFVEKSGIAYPPKLWDGTTTSYLLYDNGWRYANGEFNRNNPESPLYYQCLDYSSDVPFTTLSYPNRFGNYERFTNLNGSSITGNVLSIIDNLYNCIYAISPELNVMEGHLNKANNFNIGDYNNFRVANIQEVVSVLNDWRNYEPLTYFTNTISGLVLNARYQFIQVFYWYKSSLAVVASSAWYGHALYIKYLD